MLVDVHESVKNNKRIDDKSCIVCEHCVTACPEECLRLTPVYHGSNHLYE